MRNLNLVHSFNHHIGIGTISASTFDVDENALFVASERSGLDGEVEVDLWRVDNVRIIKISLLSVLLNPVLVRHLP